MAVPQELKIRGGGAKQRRGPGQVLVGEVKPVTWKKKRVIGCGTKEEEKFRREVETV